MDERPNVIAARPGPTSRGAVIDCQVCSYSITDDHRHAAREMMFGTRETFDYFECTYCGCLQLHPVPHDLPRFYPPQYRAFAPVVLPKTSRQRLKRRFAIVYNRLHLRANAFLARLNSKRGHKI